jgi:hypothetical protein
MASGHECGVSIRTGTEGEPDFRLVLCGKPASLRWYGENGLAIWACAEHYDARERCSDHDREEG